MAELPEVETIRREFDKEVVGKRIKTVEVPGRKETIAHHANKKQFITRLEGAKVSGLSRKGTLLIARLDTDELLLIDVSKGGQMLRTTAKDPVVKGTQVVFTFTQSGQLRFVDLKGGLSLAVVTPEELKELHPELATLGSDPLDEPISWTKFGEQIFRREVKLKMVLMDPTVLAGIGPVYSDEILFAAGLRHDRQSESLSTQEMRRLYRSVVEVVHAAAKHHGATLSDGLYADMHGKPGDYGSELKVYERDGEQCRRCRATITKGKLSGRTVYFCPECQV